MALRKLWARTSSWFADHKSNVSLNGGSLVGDDTRVEDYKGSPNIAVADNNNRSDKTVVKTVPLRSEIDNITKQQESFNRLVDKLQGINESLHHQLALNEEIVNKVDKLPGLLENIPMMMESQQKIAEQLLEQLITSSGKNQQLQEAIEKIPVQIAKQTETLAGMNQQLSSSAESDERLMNNFQRFNETLTCLNQSSQSHKESIQQMSETFATSDRYLKYLMTKQNKRFMWVFIIAMTICSASILALIAMVVYLGV
ncbi:MAG TPA: hypothetical protein PLP05_05740 [Sedimentisphaerales bacterium]|nr:hypothetical protein [Sedimentisphaerales bacterium]